MLFFHPVFLPGISGQLEQLHRRPPSERSFEFRLAAAQGNKGTVLLRSVQPSPLSPTTIVRNGRTVPDVPSGILRLLPAYNPIDRPDGCLHYSMKLSRIPAGGHNPLCERQFKSVNLLTADSSGRARVKGGCFYYRAAQKTPYSAERGDLRIYLCFD